MGDLLLGIVIGMFIVWYLVMFFDYLEIKKHNKERDQWWKKNHPDIHKQVFKGKK